LTLKLPPELTVTHAIELKALLLEALKSGEAVELDAHGVCEVDLAGLQLLCAMARSAGARGLTLKLPVVARSEALARALRLARFERTPETQWLAEEKSHA